MAIARLGYLGLTATDHAAWGPFASDILGLMTINGGDGGVYLKMDEHPFRIMVHPGEEDRLSCVGWEVDDSAAYEAVLGRLETAGVEVTAGDEEGARRRCVTEYSQAKDPAGNSVEIYHTRTGVGGEFVSPQGVSKFLTGDMGLGHLVVPAPNQDETHVFYRDVLGFGDSDDLTLPAPAEGAPEMRIVFMHAGNPRHHSLALFNYPSPTGIAHLMLEVPSIDEVGSCLDRITAAGVPLMATLGRHCNDNMLSFYAVGPGGIAVEYGCDGLQLDWDEFEPTKSTVADIWGHEYQPPEV